MFPDTQIISGALGKNKPKLKKWGAKAPEHPIETISKGAMNTLKQDIALRKTITYRVAVGVLGAGLVWVATGNIFATAGISVTTEVMRTAVYYAHEKMYMASSKN